MPSISALKGVHSNRIVGYSIDSRVKSSLAVAAMGNAVSRRHADGADVAGCVLHTDRGSQFRSRRLVPAPPPRHGRLDGARRRGRGPCGYGVVLRAAADERLELSQVATRDELRIAIVTWVERTYDGRRRQPRLGRLTPVEYGLIMMTTATQVVQP
ncbi:hypothetical protein GCM10009858_44070 [Terrabacter carboxydivorans]|uniref:Integrase catalytic domain-containing protein n=1 Tax=Terrabacter carboxydivorans TaxID=619730 RepID=A0ABP5ZP21_9MICO